MIVSYSSTFKKQYKKLPLKIRNQFDARLLMYIKNQNEQQLSIHMLKGKYAGYWSMNVSGDFRALFRKQGDEILIFGLIGTHSELYG